jgi:hypothetical protein
LTPAAQLESLMKSADELLLWASKQTKDGEPLWNDFCEELAMHVAVFRNSGKKLLEQESAPLPSQAKAGPRAETQFLRTLLEIKALWKEFLSQNNISILGEVGHDLDDLITDEIENARQASAVPQVDLEELRDAFKPLLDITQEGDGFPDDQEVQFTVKWERIKRAFSAWATLPGNEHHIPAPAAPLSKTGPPIIAKKVYIVPPAGSTWDCSFCKARILYGCDPQYCSVCGAKFTEWDRSEAVERQFPSLAAPTQMAISGGNFDMAQIVTAEPFHLIFRELLERLDAMTRLAEAVAEADYLDPLPGCRGRTFTENIHHSRAVLSKVDKAVQG